MTPHSRIAVVTGASRGIGRAIALRFAQSGYQVWALARTADALGALQAELEGAPGSLHPLVADLSHAEGVLAAALAVLAATGPQTPFVLVNNAGIAPSAPLAKTDLEAWERTQFVNVTAPFLLCRELVPSMVKAGAGRIVNIASTAAVKGFKYTSAYCASKHALLGLTRALAVELASKGVTVNAVCPGWTDTDLLAHSAKQISKSTGKTETEARDVLAHMNPMGRLIHPHEVAELCLFLVSDAAAAVTGATYLMDGGETV